MHCKTIVADDLWFAISSSNLTRLSMTYDSEIGVMAIDQRTRRGGQVLAHDYRVELMAAHLGLVPEERALIADPHDAFRLIKDYLDGRWPGRHIPIERSTLGLIEQMDTDHTHYGIQPADADGTFVDAVNILADPDGTKDDLFPIGLVAWSELKEALKAGTQDFPFGGMGKLRLNFDVSNLGDPANIIVDVGVKPAIGGEDSRIVLKKLPATSTATVGVIRIGQRYSVRAVAALASAPEIPLAPAIDRDTNVLTEFDTTFTVSLTT